MPIIEDELLRLKLIFPPGYPKFPPRGYFVEDVYHPSVGEDGLIGLKILDGPPSAVRKEVGGKSVGTWGMGIEWVETMTVARILTTIQNMLEDPDDKDSDCVVLNEEAHREAHYNHNLFDEKVRLAFRQKRDYVRRNRAAPPTCAAAAALRDGTGTSNSNQSVQMKKLKDKYDNYNELSHYDGGYNDDAKAARYKEKVWKDHSADNIDKELMPRKQKMIDEEGNAVV